METFHSLWSSSLRPGRHAFDMEEFDLKDVVHLVTAASGTFIYALKPFSNQPKMMPAKQDTPMTTPMHANASGKALARHTMGPGLRRQ